MRRLRRVRRRVQHLAAVVVIRREGTGPVLLVEETAIGRSRPNLIREDRRYNRCVRALAEETLAEEIVRNLLNQILVGELDRNPRDQIRAVGTVLSLRDRTLVEEIVHNLRDQGVRRSGDVRRCNVRRITSGETTGRICTGIICGTWPISTLRPGLDSSSAGSSRTTTFLT
jgi:hypothetical protein